GVSRNSHPALSGLLEQLNEGAILSVAQFSAPLSDQWSDDILQYILQELHTHRVIRFQEN
ncbi:MAG: hypothetical protein AAFQ98_15500, partial [Bacteroidota bacterium]